MKLLLFEDTEDNAGQLLEPLRKELAGKGDVVRFCSEKDDPDATYEDRLHSEMERAEYQRTTLIIADRDLSKTSHFRGLSEPTVRRVAHALAIPECSYTQIDEGEYLRAAEQREACIAIAIGDTWASCARPIVSIASGFEDIRSQLEAQKDSFDIKRSPWLILADILGKPEYAEKMSLYASGDRHRLHSVLQMRSVKEDERVPRLSCFLGYWLWDSILRYPGVVVNTIAASSYLNIEQGVFEENEDVRNCFSAAAYDGPFHEAKGPMWWRGALDDILADQGFEDGRSYVESVLGRRVAGSECCEDPTLPAGYYCMLSERPVSLQNSTGGLAWFPRGADLARVSNSQLEELGPWLS